MLGKRTKSKQACGIPKSARRLMGSDPGVLSRLNHPPEKRRYPRIGFGVWLQLRALTLRRGIPIRCGSSLEPFSRPASADVIPLRSTGRWMMKLLSRKGVYLRQSLLPRPLTGGAFFL